MEMDDKYVFTGKTVAEALDLGLSELNLTLAEAEYEVLEEGKRKLFGSVKAKIRIIPKEQDGEETAKGKKPEKPAEKVATTDDIERATQFIDGLLAIMGIEGKSEVAQNEQNLTLNIKTPNSARVIGKRGDVLDAIQCIAGAVANIGKDEYKKIVVDCENYRAQREQTLKNLAVKLAKKAVETGRKMILEPMSPYERRIIHAALADNTEVKTVSEGKEPARYIVVIPNNANPNDRGVHYGEKRGRGNGGGRPRNNDRGDRRDRRPEGRNSRGPRNSGGVKRGKKEIYFGTFLGNSNDNKNNEE